MCFLQRNNIHQINRKKNQLFEQGNVLCLRAHPVDQRHVVLICEAELVAGRVAPRGQVAG